MTKAVLGKKWCDEHAATIGTIAEAPAAHRPYIQEWQASSSRAENVRKLCFVVTKQILYQCCANIKKLSYIRKVFHTKSVMFDENASIAAILEYSE